MLGVCVQVCECVCMHMCALCMYVFICLYEHGGYSCMCVYVCAFVWRPEVHSPHHMCLSVTPVLSFESATHWTWCSLIFPDWPTSELQVASCLPPSMWIIEEHHNACLDSYVGAGNPFPLLRMKFLKLKYIKSGDILTQRLKWLTLKKTYESPSCLF